MENLSREIGVKMAELEFLKTKKANDLELAQSLLQATNNELLARKQELARIQVRPCYG